MNIARQKGDEGEYRVKNYAAKKGFDYASYPETNPGDCTLKMVVDNGKSPSIIRGVQIKYDSSITSVALPWKTTSGSVTRSDDLRTTTNNKFEREYVAGDWDIMSIYLSMSLKIIWVPFSLLRTIKSIKLKHPTVEPRNTKQSYYYYADFLSIRKSFDPKAIYRPRFSDGNFWEKDKIDRREDMMLDDVIRQAWISMRNQFGDCIDDSFLPPQSFVQTFIKKKVHPNEDPDVTFETGTMKKWQYKKDRNINKKSALFFE